MVNGDSPWSDLLLDGLFCKRIACGTLTGCDARATDVVLNGCEGVSFLYRTGEGVFPVSVPIPGAFTVQNALLALTAAKALGVQTETAVRSLARIPTVPGRMERVDTAGLPFSVFIDYAHTEAALRSLLCSVRAFRRPGERIVVLFGCGGDRDPSKRREMGKTAEELADFTIVTSDNSRSEDPKQIILSILSGMSDKDRRRVIVVTRDCDHAMLRSMGLGAASTLEDGIARACAAAGPGARIAAIPDGVSVVVERA